MQKSEVVANRFIFLLQTGTIRKNILPNSSLDYTGDQEKKDLEEFVRFVNSAAFDELKKFKVEQYYGEY